MWFSFISLSFFFSPIFVLDDLICASNLKLFTMDYYSISSCSLLNEFSSWLTTIYAFSLITPTDSLLIFGALSLCVDTKDDSEVIGICYTLLVCRSGVDISCSYYFPFRLKRGEMVFLAGSGGGALLFRIWFLISSYIWCWYWVN